MPDNEEERHCRMRAIVIGGYSINILFQYIDYLIIQIQYINKNKEFIKIPELMDNISSKIEVIDKCNKCISQNIIQPTQDDIISKYGELYFIYN